MHARTHTSCIRMYTPESFNYYYLYGFVTAFTTNILSYQSSTHIHTHVHTHHAYGCTHLSPSIITTCMALSTHTHARTHTSRIHAYTPESFNYYYLFGFVTAFTTNILSISLPHIYTRTYTHITHTCVHT